jgi:hypothetical protein
MGEKKADVTVFTLRRSDPSPGRIEEKKPSRMRYKGVSLFASLLSTIDSG